MSHHYTESLNSSVIENMTDANYADALHLENFSDSDKESTVSSNSSIMNLEKQLTIAEDDYTILTHKERLTLALFLSLIGICSAMSMPIYWTALPQLEEAFHTTEERINFTVTAYLCFQAVAPLFISSISDVYGRRPVILICILGGVVTNVGLAVSRTYWLMIFLRCVLASFLAPLISITSACVGDFTTRRNRGGLTALTSGFTLIGQGIAPFLGAVMATAWKWPAIFWFSAALQGLILTIAFLMVPETHRAFVGNLSVIPKNPIHRAPILMLFKDRLVKFDETLVEKNLKQYAPWKPLLLISKIQVFYILLPSSILFSIWTISQTSMTVHLSKYYHYSTLDIGLCFFAPGTATVTGTLLSGKLLDKLYKKKKELYNQKYAAILENYNKELLDHHHHHHRHHHHENSNQDLNEDKFRELEMQEIPPFNIIYVRLYYIPYAAIIVCLAAIVFGWCLQHVIKVPVILVMSFLITFFCMFPLNITATVLVDMFPEISGGATALNNLFRCGMSAIFVSCLDKMEVSMSLGGTYTFMGGIGLLFSCLIVLLILKSDSILRKSAANSK